MLTAYQLINQRTRASLIGIILQQALHNGFLDRRRIDIELEDEEIFGLDDPFDHIDCVELVAFLHREPNVHKRVDADEIVGDLLKCGRVVEGFDFDGDEAREGLAAGVIGVVEPLARCGAAVAAPDFEVRGAEVEVDVLRGLECDADAGVGGRAQGAVPGGKTMGAPFLLAGFFWGGWGGGVGVSVRCVSLRHDVGL